MSPPAARLYKVLTGEPVHVELLAEKAGMTLPEALVALTELELAGCAVSHAGRQYALRFEC